MWSTAAGCGRVKWAAWWALNCRCWPWSTCISSPTKCPKSIAYNKTARQGSLRTSSISNPKSTCGRNVRAWCLAPMSRIAARGSRRTRHGNLAANCCSRIWTASRPILNWVTSISRRLPNAGIKRVINGPFTFTPDGNPLVGPVQGVTKFLVRLRCHGGLQPRRWRGPCPVAMDGQWRSGL